MMDDYFTEPTEEDSTKLGKVPEKAKKGSMVNMGLFSPFYNSMYNYWGFMELIYFILAAYGMTFIIVYGKIFEDLRPVKDYSKKWNTLFHCPLCVGFWVGVFLFSVNGFTELFTFEYSLTNAFLCGCISAGTSYLLSMIVDDFGIRRSKDETNN